jgi:hypothetical protein
MEAFFANLFSSSIQRALDFVCVLFQAWWSSAIILPALLSGKRSHQSGTAIAQFFNSNKRSLGKPRDKREKFLTCFDILQANHRSFPNKILVQNQMGHECPSKKRRKSKKDVFVRQSGRIKELFYFRGT